MNVTTLDVETSYHRKYDDTVSSPFEGDILVSVGYKINDNPCEYLCFNHNHQKPTKDAKQILQKGSSFSFCSILLIILCGNIFIYLILSYYNKKNQ